MLIRSFSVAILVLVSVILRAHGRRVVAHRWPSGHPSKSPESPPLIYGTHEYIFKRFSFSFRYCVSMNYTKVSAYSDGEFILWNVSSIIAPFSLITRTI